MKTRKITMKASDTAYSLFQKCKTLFPVWCWDEEAIKSVINDRQGDYEIEFEDNIEADEKLKNLSANDLKEKGIIGITLPERLKMELDYFKETGKHLDIKNITLCAGSRYSDGLVPFVCWSDDDEVDVSGYDPGDRYDFLRSREAVSKSSTSNLETLKNNLAICPHCHKEIKLSK